LNGSTYGGWTLLSALAAHGLPFHDFAHSVGSLAEACTVIRRAEFRSAVGAVRRAVASHTSSPCANEIETR
jgi:hypothetical protein